MKNIIVGLLVLMPALSFASSYEEKPLAQCGSLTLIQIKIGSQMPDGTVSSSIKYEVEEIKNRLYVDVAEMNDLTAYQFVLSDNVGHSITKSFEFVGPGGATVYRYEGKVCKSL